MGMAMPRAVLSPGSAGRHPRQVPQVESLASLASRPSRLDEVRSPMSLSSHTGLDVSTAQGSNIPVICNQPESQYAGESTQAVLINQLLISLNRFNENVSVNHPTPVAPSPVNVWSGNSVGNITPVSTHTNMPACVPASVSETCFKEVFPCQMSPFSPAFIS